LAAPSSYWGPSSITRQSRTRTWWYRH